MKKDKKIKKPGEGALRAISNSLFLLKIALKASPFITLHKLLATSKNRIIVFFEHTWLLGFMIDCIAGNEPFRKPASVVMLMFAIVCLTVNVFDNFVNHKYDPGECLKIDRAIHDMVYTKAEKMDLRCYDDPEFYDDFVWATREAKNQVYNVINTVGGIIGNIIGVAINGIYLMTRDGLGMVAVLVSFAGSFVISFWLNKLWYKLDEESNPISRKLSYIKRVFYLTDHAKELRLSNVKEQLYRDFDSACNEMRALRKKRTLKICIINILNSFFLRDFLIQGVYLLYLLWRTIVKKAFSYGTMVTLYNSCNSVSNSFRSISYFIPKLQEHSLYIEKIRHYLDNEITVRSPEAPLPLPESGDIVLDNVTFGYKEGENVLDGISMTVKKGERIALVGYNGAGKTTLVKLMMRLYDPTDGVISYGGTDVRQLELDGYRDKFETVFQDYQIFAATVGQNISADDAPLDAERAREACEKSGFARKLDTLPDGFDTPLTREFENNGVNLSGGEAQSLVIARALYKNSPVIILDEPSSALDPVAEYNLNKTMLDIEGEHTVITISHRLSTTKTADKIYMLEKGRIIEEGSHDELMRLDGKYAEMFRLQAEKYRAQVI